MLGSDSGAPSVLPARNADYALHSYWDNRFAHEDHFDWLTDYTGVRDTIHQHIAATDRILVIGCGNSAMSAAMYDDGFTAITNLDYSHTVIDKQRQRNSGRPAMQWVMGDFTKLNELFAPQLFDIVLDKCSMDALVVDCDDVWRPNRRTRQQCHALLTGVSAMLKTGGKFVSISFTQPHFRRRFLQRQEFGWNCSVEVIGEGILASFVYTCIKGGECKHWPHSDSEDEENESKERRVTERRPSLPEPSSDEQVAAFGAISLGRDSNEER